MTDVAPSAKARPAQILWRGAEPSQVVEASEEDCKDRVDRKDHVDRKDRVDLRGAQNEPRTHAISS